MKKRILVLSLTIITTIILILACAFVLVGCKGVTCEDENFIYSIFLNHAKVKEVKNKDATELVIPSSISYKNRTYTVDEIGESAFTLCRELKSVSISDSVTSIGKSAFSVCLALTSIHIPDSVTVIGGYVFDGCTSLQSVTIGNSVRRIGKETFFRCESLTSIVIPDGVTEIGREAFRDCSSLKSVTMGKSVKKIGYDSFRDCYRLVEVYNKSSLNIVKGSTDYGLVGHYAKDIYREKYQSRITTTEDGYVLYTAGDTKSLIQYIGSETDLTLPDGITEINKYAFYYCDSLTNVTIPDSVTSIGSNAFDGCMGLTYMIIPDSVTTMGCWSFELRKDVTIYCEAESMPTGWDKDWNGGPFFQKSPIVWGYVLIDNCFYKVKDGNAVFGWHTDKNITNFEIPSTIIYKGKEYSVTSIDNEAFVDCIFLASITIPDSITSIGYNSFLGCYRLVEVCNKSSLDIVKGSTDYGFVGLYAKEIYNAEHQSRISITEDRYVVYTAEDTKSLVAYIGSETNLTLPDDITEINNYAFRYCIFLESITIPDSVISIGESAFECCRGLTSITIPDGVTSIGCYAFDRCSSLKTIFISDSVTSIGVSAFDIYDDMTIYCEAENQPSDWNKKWNASNCSVVWGYVLIEGCFYKIKDGIAVFGWCTDKDITNFEIPSTVKYKGKEYSVTSIGERAFAFCRSLESITIPHIIQSIGKDAFSNCSGLKRIVIPKSVTSIGRYAFENCDNITIYCESESKPSGWDSGWNISNCSVVWGYKSDN